MARKQGPLRPAGALYPGGVLHRDHILGTWRLVSWTADTDGEVSHPLGIDPVGTIVYTADGFMSAQLMRRDRPAYDRPWPTGGTAEQLVSAAAGYLAYSGPFTLDESTGIVHHHVEVSLVPNWVGGVQDRDGRLVDDTLVLSADTISRRGVVAHSTLTWRRPGSGG